MTNTTTISGVTYTIHNLDACVSGFTRDIPKNVIILEKIQYNDSYYSVTSIGKYAFESCTNLKSIIIPDSVTCIGESVFYNCSKLTSVSIGNSVTYIGDCVFYNCTSLSYITFNNQKNLLTLQGVNIFTNANKITTVIFFFTTNESELSNAAINLKTQINTNNHNVYYV